MAEGGPPLLATLPPDALDRVLGFVARARDLAAANAAGRLFCAAPPGGRSAVERALRERARARAHALPSELPAAARTWSEELLARERVLELAHAHATSAVAGQGTSNEPLISAFVDVDGGLHTCGQESGMHVWGARFGGTPEGASALGQGRSPVLLPTRVASLSAVRVLAVAAGTVHLLALSEAGAVYGCGGNSRGQLGLGDCATQQAFVLLDALQHESIACLAAGAQHSLALSAGGAAFSWGWNCHGQLGHGDTEDRWEPARVEALDGVRIGGVGGGAFHSLLLATGGAVYSCGWGLRGQLGHGDAQELRAPRRIEALAGVRAAHVSAGFAHSLVVDAAGGVHAFGVGRCGCLGQPDDSELRTPTRVGALSAVRAVRACAGYDSSAVLGADGSVRVFGDNARGQLGLGPRAPQEVRAPEAVPAFEGARVAQCSLGRAHALFATADGAAHACGRQSAALGLGQSAAFGTAEFVLRAVEWPARIEQLPRPVRVVDPR